MKISLVTLALGAAMISAPALAQAPGGGMQRDTTRAQTQQRADMMFQLMDSNRDGVVTRAEAEQAAAQFAARSGGDSGGQGGGRIQRMIAQAFGTADSITLAQMEAQALARFDAQDLNHDGVVTAAERAQVREQRAQMQPPMAQPPMAQPPMAMPGQPPRQ